MPIKVSQRIIQKLQPRARAVHAVRLTFQVNYELKVINKITWVKVDNDVTVANATTGSVAGQLLFAAGFGYDSKVTWAGSADPASLTLLDVASSDAGNYSCSLYFTDGSRMNASLVNLDTILPTCRYTCTLKQCSNVFQ